MLRLGRVLGRTLRFWVHPSPSSTNCKSPMLPLLEQLEPRHLLSIQSVMSADIVDTPKAVQRGGAGEVEALVVASSADLSPLAPNSGANHATSNPMDYYVSPTGSDENSGASLGDALRTINAALRQVQAGDRVLVMPGVYREEFLNPPGGTDWEHPVRIRAYDLSLPPILRPRGGAARVFSFASSSSSYIEVNGFVLDAVHVRYDAVKITWGSGGSHHIRLKNSEVMNAPNNGILITGDSHGVRDNELINLNVHHNGTDQGHGIYLAAPYTLVRNSRIHDNNGWGIHAYSGDASHSVFRDNSVFANTRDGRAVGIGVYSGEGIRIRDNIIEGNDNGISLGGQVSDAVVRGNLISQNTVAVTVQTPSVEGTVIARNVLEDNEDNRIHDNGTDTVVRNNEIND